LCKLNPGYVASYELAADMFQGIRMRTIYNDKNSMNSATKIYNKLPTIDYIFLVIRKLDILNYINK